MNYKSRLLTTTLLGLFLSACASTKDAEVIDQPLGNSNNNASVSSSNGIGDRRVIVDSGLNNAYGTGLSAQELRNLGIQGDPLQYKTIYFQYNSSTIDSRSRVIVSAHARHLQSRRNVSVSLAGHADERGTRDFNLALGERRAQTVAGLIKAGGASNSIRTISYGEERPLVTSHNEAAWTKNRRVEINY